MVVGFTLSRWVFVGFVRVHRVGLRSAAVVEFNHVRPSNHLWSLGSLERALVIVGFNRVRP